VDAGEAFIAEVYSSIRESDLWNDTLLLILYDEHGGLFDHVTPPNLVLPENPDIPASKDFGFRFDRLGLRVPAVFVSPRISPGTIIHTEFDHCSIVATIRKLFCLDKTPFSWREARAATFDDIADLSDAEIRTDNVELPPAVASEGAVPMARAVVLSGADRATANATMAAQGSPAAPHVADGNFAGANAPPVPTPAVRKPTDLTMLMAQAMAHTLSVLGLRTGLQVGQIATAQDAANYLKQAANALQQQKGAA
jgi:phospholipase C